MLFTLDTPRLRLAWSQRRAKRPGVAPPEGPPFGLAVEARAEVPAVTLGDGDTAHLFEQTDYTLLVRSKTGEAVALRHRDPVLLRGLHVAEGGQLLHGTLNFGTQVGRSRFVVEAGGEPLFAFEVEVYPSKLDYRSDYRALRDDVRELAAGLAFEHLRATTTGADVRPTPGSTAAWLALLGHVAADLDAALRYAAQHPLWGTARAVAVQPLHRIRRPDAAVRRALRHGSGHGAETTLPGGLAARMRLPAAASRYTLDTPTHRWLAAQLRYIRDRLAALRRAEARRKSGPRRPRVLAEIEALQARVARLQRLGLFQAAGSPPAEPPLPLRTAPGYREAYRACLLLRQNLDLDGGPLALSLKDLHLLYEYWCFLTLARLVAEITGTPTPLRTLVGVERDGLRVRLRQGRAQPLRFDAPDGGRLELIYNPRFAGRGFLVPQQPDILLTRYRPGAAPAHYVLDAKYRLDASPGYRRRYGVPGPPADALNDLHRYRDALGAAGTPVVQALALYPHREAAPGVYAASKLHRLLGEAGIGAIPLLPGATGHLAAWLRRVVQGA